MRSVSLSVCSHSSAASAAGVGGASQVSPSVNVGQCANERVDGCWCRRLMESRNDGDVIPGQDGCTRDGSIPDIQPAVTDEINVDRRQAKTHQMSRGLLPQP